MKMTFEEFAGKTAIISGGAGGMGYVCAEMLCKWGANVVVADANKEAAEKAAEALCAKGGNAIAVQTDVRFYEQTEATAQKALEQFGSIDILVNFAGGYSARIRNVDGYFPTMDVDAIEWGIDVNLKGPVHFARAVLMQMIRQKSGVIINIGSTSGSTGSGAVDYSTSKSGIMNGLTRSVALYGAKYGVRCNCVTPGPVLTRAAMAKMVTPLGFAAEPEEVVNLVLYLCSDAGRCITGANYLIDCGRAAAAMDGKAIPTPEDR